MADVAEHFLLSGFTDFFEELAAIRLASLEGRLGPHLAVEGQSAMVSGADYAIRVSSLLQANIQNQTREVRRMGTDPEIAAFCQVEYLMAALADELLLLDREWPGRDDWLDNLLEMRLFSTRRSGRQFFEIAEALLAQRSKTALDVDLGSILLLCLRLGFQGVYRGEAGEQTLQSLRERLYRFVQSDIDAAPVQPLCVEAYQQLPSERRDARIAPLAPWYRAAWMAALSYLLLSSAVWYALIQPLRTLIDAH